MISLIFRQPPLPMTSTARNWRHSHFGLAATAVFALFVTFQLSHHSMWRDELNAWGLVLASPTLPSLFSNLHYEGHPGLWHLLLWVASAFSANPVAMQFVHALIAIAVAGMIAIVSPFSLIEKVMLLLNFFVVYEYAVFSRNYGIGLLLALLYSQLRATRPERLMLNSVVLGLLANTNVFAFILSGAFAFEYLVDRWQQRRGGFGQFIAALAPSMSVYLALVVVSIATFAPAADISWRTTGAPMSSQHDLYAVKTLLVDYWEMPLLPILFKLGMPQRSSGLLWQLLDLHLLLLPVLIAAVIFAFRRNKNLLLVVGITAVGSAMFGQLFYFGYIRHWGINFVAVLAALWMQWIWQPGRSLPVLVFFAVGAVTGIAASPHVWRAPFSQAENTANWISKHEPAQVALIGTSDTIVAGVAIELARPIYFLDCSCVDTFLRYERRRDDFDDTQIPSRLAKAIRDIGPGPKLLVLTSPVSPEQQREIVDYGVRRLTPVSQFVGSQVGEDFYLYEIGSTVQ
jgi:hypothetical protein